VDATSLLREILPHRAEYVRIARRRLGNDADAEDVVQQALSRAVTQVGSLRDVARARPWFYRILRNAVTDHHRARSRLPGTVDGAADLPDETSPATETPRACHCAPQLLAGLRPAYAQVIQKVDVEGSDAASAAASLGISVAHLHVRLHRARHALRTRVQHHCGVRTHHACLDCCCGGGERCG
jgi:RNA polymerase sigma-70 factor (ECF subfamily)